VRRLVLTVAVVAAAVAAAPAHADQPFDRWIGHMKVPPPQVDLVLDNCPDAPTEAGETGCTWPGGPVYVAPYLEDSLARAMTRQILYHELGHQFDYQHATPALRRQFMRVAHLHGPWRTADRATSPNEQFADAYMICAYTYRTERRDWLDRGRVRSDGYPYVARWRSHRRFCRALREFR
jgi:hypothetical protein